MRPSVGGVVSGRSDASRALPARVRACIALRFLDDMSIRETADEVGLGVGVADADGEPLELVPARTAVDPAAPEGADPTVWKAGLSGWMVEH